MQSPRRPSQPRHWSFSVRPARPEISALTVPGGAHLCSDETPIEAASRQVGSESDWHRRSEQQPRCWHAAWLGLPFRSHACARRLQSSSAAISERRKDAVDHITQVSYSIAAPHAPLGCSYGMLDARMMGATISLMLCVRETLHGFSEGAPVR